MITDPLAQFPDNPLYQLNAWKSKKLIVYFLLKYSLYIQIILIINKGLC